MSLIRRFMEWWRRPKRPTEIVECEDDEIMQMLVSRVFETGNVVIANRRDDGTIEIEEVEPDGKDA